MHASVFAHIDPDSFMFPIIQILLYEFIICAEVIYKPNYAVSWRKEVSQRFS